MAWYLISIIKIILDLPDKKYGSKFMNRLFFALDIIDTDKQKLANWREQQLNLPFKAVPQANFHVTLAFIGAVTDEQKKILMTEAGQISRQLHCKIKQKVKTSSSKTLSFDHCELFKKSKVLFLGTSSSPQWLNLLAEHLGACAKNMGLFQENRPYQPHITMYRKASGEQLKHLKKNIIFEIKSFSLYQSISTETGVCYKPVETWFIG